MTVEGISDLNTMLFHLRGARVCPSFEGVKGVFGVLGYDSVALGHECDITF